MGYQISFRENQSYSALGLNDITKDVNKTLQTKFEDTISYGIGKLNDIRANLLTQGIAKGVDKACACYVTENNIKIDSGKVFFSNGIRVVIDTDGMSIPYPAGTAGTVWLEYLPDSNDIKLQFMQEAPSEWSVKIAEIDQNGKVTDARQYCYMKDQTSLPHGNRMFEKNISFYVHSISETTPAYEMKVDSTDYQSMCLLSNDSRGHVLALYNFSLPSLHSTCYFGGKGLVCTDYNMGFCAYAYIDDYNYRVTYIRAVYEGDVVKFYVKNGGYHPGYANFNIIMF